MMRTILSSVVAMAAAGASAAWAQGAPKPSCAATDAALPADLAAWRNRGGAARSALPIGIAATVDLRPTAAVRYAVRPEKPGAADTFGGSVAFDIARPGLYRVSLGEGAWIDVVRGGKAIASSAHGHGPPCSTIRKIVAFPLITGRHLLQVSGSPKARVVMMITPAS